MSDRVSQLLVARAEDDPRQEQDGPRAGLMRGFDGGVTLKVG